MANAHLKPLHYEACPTRFESWQVKIARLQRERDRSFF